ncbi:MAG: hypothetical protein LBQ90_10865 [Synergistaceae bacterium]|jgi:hypothetical protein|nr:hypothetical protein [Synergistaceae bacterium]
MKKILAALCACLLLSTAVGAALPEPTDEERRESLPLIERLLSVGSEMLREAAGVNQGRRDERRREHERRERERRENERREYERRERERRRGRKNHDCNAGAFGIVGLIPVALLLYSSSLDDKTRDARAVHTDKQDTR